MIAVRKRLFVISVIMVVVLAVAGYLIVTYRPTSVRAAQVFAWIKDPESQPELVIAAGSRCGNAPFIFPNDGRAGLHLG